MLDQLQDERRGCAGEGEKGSKKSAAKSIMEALKRRPNVSVTSGESINIRGYRAT